MTAKGLGPWELAVGSPGQHRPTEQLNSSLRDCLHGVLVIWGEGKIRHLHLQLHTFQNSPPPLPFSIQPFSIQLGCGLLLLPNGLLWTGVHLKEACVLCGDQESHTQIKKKFPSTGPFSNEVGFVIPLGTRMFSGQ
jgi:hypothetical protein